VNTARAKFIRAWMSQTLAVVTHLQNPHVSIFGYAKQIAAEVD
jgi:hypothetical protein